MLRTSANWMGPNSTQMPYYSHYRMLPSKFYHVNVLEMFSKIVLKNPRMFSNLMCCLLYEPWWQYVVWRTQEKKSHTCLSIADCYDLHHSTVSLLYCRVAPSVVPWTWAATCPTRRPRLPAAMMRSGALRRQTVRLYARHQQSMLGVPAPRAEAVTSTRSQVRLRLLHPD